MNGNGIILASYADGLDELILKKYIVSEDQAKYTLIKIENGDVINYGVIDVHPWGGIIDIQVSDGLLKAQEDDTTEVLTRAKWTFDKKEYNVALEILDLGDSFYDVELVFKRPELLEE